ncbi:hypothetical protein ZTR_06026 [Talaromyces verruculosus]|nr:hypothetical protein ZTR_06026 [Talaromyces verruculosus]
MNASLLRRSIPDNLSNEFIFVPTLTMPQISHRLARLRLLNSTSETEHSWENPEASIGEFCRTMGRSQCWHAQGPARDLFIRLADEVKTYLDRNCEPPSRELHWSLYMIGRTKSTARPVLMFICEERNSREIARKTIKESGILQRYPGVDTADCSHPPDFGQLVQLSLLRNRDDLENLTSAGSWSMGTGDSLFPNFDHSVSGRRINHSAIGASGFPGPNFNTAASLYPSDDSVIKLETSETSIFYRPTDGILGSHVFGEGVNSQSRKATAGVIVKLGDKILCFLTVAHAFESRRLPSDSCPPFEYDIDGESDSDDEEFIQTIRQGSRSPLSKHSDWSLGESEKSISRSSSSQESELNTRETVSGRITTNPTATVEAAATTHNYFQQILDESTHHRRHSPSRSRPTSRSRARFPKSIGLGVPALTGDVALARNNLQDARRSRSRHRDRSQSRGAGSAGPDITAMIETARSKSRSRSKRRTRQDLDFFSHASAHERPLELGTLLASSVEGSERGLDYALIKIEGFHASTANRLIFRNEILDLTLNLTQFSDSQPQDAKIVAITGSSGYLSGRLLGTPSFSRAPDQEAPSQELWTVRFDGKIEEGDCGTCVFDAQTGDFYGHVVAGNPDSGYAYIIPAYQIRDDIFRRFGKNVHLYKPAIQPPHKQIFTIPDLPWAHNNRSQSKGSPPVPTKPYHLRRSEFTVTKGNPQTPTPNYPRRLDRSGSYGNAALVRNGREYFTPGRIFVVRWSEPVQDLRTRASSNSEDISVINGQPMISYWRRMVVIRTSQAEHSSTCVGMFTYGGQGLAKPGLDLDKHALVFDERLDEPQTRPDEPSLKGTPLAVWMESPLEKLDPMYRINFGVTYRVEHSREVRDVGHISERSMNDFEAYVAEALKTN